MYKRLCNPLKTKSFFLFGARGTGKTSLLRAHFDPTGSLWIDLLDQREALRFTQSPEELRARVTTFVKQHRCNPEFVIIDEIQRVPQLLNEVHSLIEDRSFQPRLKFALTGSSARKLRRGGANLLAGRALLNAIHPLTQRELGDQFDLDTALNWGTLPEIALSTNNQEKSEILNAYFSIYLKEEIKEEQIVRKLDPFARFLEVAAQSNGTILNYAKIGRDCQVDEAAIKRYFQILEDTLIGFSLQSYHASVRKRQSKQSKFYFFDLGVKKAIENTLMVPLSPKSYSYDKAFEHFVILECIRLNDYLRKGYRFFYFKSGNVEVDLVIERPAKPLALVEIKSSARPDPVEIARLEKLSLEFDKAESLIFCRATEPYFVGKVKILPWSDGLELLT